MKYEIFWGDETYFEQASTPFQACMKVFKDRSILEHKEPIISPFIVRDLDNDEEQTIELEVIVRLRMLSNNYIEESDLDPNCPLALAGVK
jgi:hypothetical protein